MSTVKNSISGSKKQGLQEVISLTMDTGVDILFAITIPSYYWPKVAICEIMNVIYFKFHFFHSVILHATQSKQAEKILVSVPRLP